VSVSHYVDDNCDAVCLGHWWRRHWAQERLYNVQWRRWILAVSVPGRGDCDTVWSVAGLSVRLLVVLPVCIGRRWRHVRGWRHWARDRLYDVQWRGRASRVFYVCIIIPSRLPRPAAATHSQVKQAEQVCTALHGNQTQSYGASKRALSATVD